MVVRMPLVEGLACDVRGEHSGASAIPLPAPPENHRRAVVAPEAPLHHHVAAVDAERRRAGRGR